MEVKLTDRGFQIINFIDRYDAECSLQKSSLATEDAIWFGCDGDRMHLTREQVSELLPYLISFVETGELCNNAQSNELKE